MIVESDTRRRLENGRVVISASQAFLRREIQSGNGPERMFPGGAGRVIGQAGFVEECLGVSSSVVVAQPYI